MFKRQSFFSEYVNWANDRPNTISKFENWNVPHPDTGRQKQEFPRPELSHVIAFYGPSDICFRTTKELKPSTKKSTFTLKYNHLSQIKVSRCSGLAVALAPRWIFHLLTLLLIVFLFFNHSRPISQQTTLGQPKE